MINGRYGKMTKANYFASFVTKNRSWVKQVKQRSKISGSGLVTSFDNWVPENPKIWHNFRISQLLSTDLIMMSCFL